MSIKASALLRQEAETEIVYFDEKGVVKFRPGAITDDMFETVQAAAEADDENVLNKLLAEVCVSWDVIGDDGKPIPFMVPAPQSEQDKAISGSTDKQDREMVNPALKRLPIPFKSAVLEQVIEAARGNSKASSETSRAGSRRTRR